MPSRRPTPGRQWEGEGLRWRAPAREPGTVQPGPFRGARGELSGTQPSAKYTASLETPVAGGGWAPHEALPTKRLETRGRPCRHRTPCGRPPLARGRGLPTPTPSPPPESPRPPPLPSATQNLSDLQRPRAEPGAREWEGEGAKTPRRNRRPLTPPSRPPRREEIEPRERPFREQESQRPGSLGGAAASASPSLLPSSAPPYLAGFVELLLQPGHRHRDCDRPGRGGLKARPGHAAATRSGSGSPGRSPRGWAPPSPPPTATATATAAVTLAHTRARRWQHCVPKPLHSPLAKPQRYANEAVGAAHASLLRGDLGDRSRAEDRPGKLGVGMDVLGVGGAQPHSASCWARDGIDLALRLSWVPGERSVLSASGSWCETGFGSQGTSPPSGEFSLGVCLRKEGSEMRLGREKCNWMGDLWEEEAVCG